MGWDEEMEGVGFGVEAGDNVATYNLQGHVHEDYLLSSFAEGPIQASTVACCLELLPIGSVHDSINVMNSNAKTIINEALQIT